MTGALLQKLADAAGSEPRYWDIQGRIHERSFDTAKFILKALGIPADSDGEIAASLATLDEKPWRDGLPPVVVAAEDHPIEIPVRWPDVLSGAVRWSLTSEGGSVTTGEIRIEDFEVRDRRDVDGMPFSLRLLVLPSQTSGYHQFDLMTNDRRSTRVIVTPEHCYLPEESASRRYWGIAAQLYSLRSARNWGMGDFSDLADLSRWAARHGADMIGINPLHALFLDDPRMASPYSPNSRLFLNPLYIDVTAVPEYVRLNEGQALARSPEMRRALESARVGELIDYPGAARLKVAVLEGLYKAFQRENAESDQHEAFRKYAADGGAALERFATFQVLSEHLKTHVWQNWPPAFRDPASPDVTALARERAERVEFFKYLQWRAAEQRSRAADAAYKGGMRLGLYGDLAVGAETASADHWANQDLFLRDLRIGAPPDPFNEAGQEWGLVPFSPGKLRASGYEQFIRLLRANMHDAGVLRIDHVMGWQRLFLVPAGAHASEGVYLRYPVEEFVAVAAVESQRNRCIVIGEDLGTVPAGFRERMAAANILSSRVFYFEQEHGHFRAPGDFPKLASVSATTHDLATLRGFWEMDDISAKTRLGILGPAEGRFAQNQRTQDKQRLLDALRTENLLPPGTGSQGIENEPWSSALARALHVYLARSSSLLLSVQLDDLVGELHQANLPDSGELANWRRRASVSVEELERDATMSESLEEIARARR